MTAIANVLTRITEIEEFLLSNANAVKGAAYRQAGLPYWTNGVQLTSTVKKDSDSWQFNYTVTMACHFAKVTEGYQMGTLSEEQAANDLLETTVLYLVGNRKLNHVTTHAALNEVDNLGITVQPGGVGLIATTPNQSNFTFGVSIPVLIPIIMRTTDYT